MYSHSDSVSICSETPCRSEPRREEDERERYEAGIPRHKKEARNELGRHKLLGPIGVDRLGGDACREQQQRNHRGRVEQEKWEEPKGRSDSVRNTQPDFAS